jgi:hypothetical protein
MPPNDLITTFVSFEHCWNAAGPFQVVVAVDNMTDVNF